MPCIPWARCSRCYDTNCCQGQEKNEDEEEHVDMAELARRALAQQPAFIGGGSTTAQRQPAAAAQDLSRKPQPATSLEPDSGIRAGMSANPVKAVALLPCAHFNLTASGVTGRKKVSAASLAPAATEDATRLNARQHRFDTAASTPSDTRSYTGIDVSETGAQRGAGTSSTGEDDELGKPMVMCGTHVVVSVCGDVSYEVLLK